MHILDFPDGFLTITKLDTHFVGSVTFLNILLSSNYWNFCFNGVMRANGTRLAALTLGGMLSSTIIYTFLQGIHFHKQIFVVSFHFNRSHVVFAMTVIRIIIFQYLYKFTILAVFTPNDGLH